MLHHFVPHETPARAVTKEIARLERLEREYAARYRGEYATLVPALPDPPVAKINCAVNSLIHNPERFARMIKDDQNAAWSEEALLGLSAAFDQTTEEHMLRFLTEFAGARRTDAYIELIRSILWSQKSTDTSEVARKALELISSPDALCEVEFRKLLLYRASSYPHNLAAIPFNFGEMESQVNLELADKYDLFGIRCIFSLLKIPPNQIDTFRLGKKIFTFAY